MNPHKHHRNDNLQKSSVLFLQLGLVLALFLAYIALEFESTKKEIGEPPTVMVDPEVIIVTDFDFTIKRKKEKIKPKVYTKSTDKFKKVENNTQEPIEVLKPNDLDEPTIDQKIINLPGDDTLDPDPDDVIDYIILEDAPVFPGCEGLVKEASKACFSKEISKFINKNFNADILDYLNLKGKQKIWVEFKVNKTGMVSDIRARASNKRLEKEAIRVVNKLPQMTPGKQRTIPVNVKYTLPITFQIN